MELAKQQVDIGLFTNNIGPMLSFWQNDVGLRLDHVLRVRRGQDQHRHDAAGSVLKINHLSEPLAVTPPSGYRELILAQASCTERRSITDPDGNVVSIVPPGHLRIAQAGIRMKVRDLDAHRRFFGRIFGFPEQSYAGGAAFRAGETMLLLEQSPEVNIDADVRGIGWRYITFQVFKVDAVHAAALGAGVREAVAPRTLGTTARISMILDPDGNWIELSQRASIVGSLE